METPQQRKIREALNRPSPTDSDATADSEPEGDTSLQAHALAAPAAAFRSLVKVGFRSRNAPNSGYNKPPADNQLSPARSTA